MGARTGNSNADARHGAVSVARIFLHVWHRRPYAAAPGAAAPVHRPSRRQQRNGIVDRRTTEMLTTEEAGRHVRLSRRTLERYRVTGEGPEYLKVGRLVFYDTAKLDAWLQLKRRRSTSDPGPPSRH